MHRGGRERIPWAEGQKESGLSPPLKVQRGAVRQLGSRCVSTSPLQPHLLASSSDFKATVVKSVPQLGLWIPKHSQIEGLPHPNVVIPRQSTPPSTLPCVSQQRPVPQPCGICSVHLGHYRSLSPWCRPNLLLPIRRLLTDQLSAQSAPLCWKVFVLNSLYLPILATQSQSVSPPAPVTPVSICRITCDFAQLRLCILVSSLTLRTPSAQVPHLSCPSCICSTQQGAWHTEDSFWVSTAWEDGWKKRGITVTVVLTG